MSAVDGWVFVVYQGARDRRSPMSAGSCPEVAYQAGSLSRLTRGRPRLPAQAGGSSYSAASLRSRVVQVTAGGSFFSSPPA